MTAIAGGMAGVVVAFKMGLARMKAKVTGKSPEPQVDADADSEPKS